MQNLMPPFINLAEVTIPQGEISAEGGIVVMPASSAGGHLFYASTAYSALNNYQSTAASGIVRLSILY
jgi:hypothetical protein